MTASYTCALKLKRIPRRELAFNPRGHMQVLFKRPASLAAPHRPLAAIWSLGGMPPAAGASSNCAGLRTRQPQQIDPRDRGGAATELLQTVAVLRHVPAIEGDTGGAPMSGDIYTCGFAIAVCSIL
ncbi:hypothetical protein BT67DRAFT_120267 [Trichocladium antarcticum]|uniref:Uncharacterized protein n=1 Tax=Trichocladium antarcticum TaxID=1450529 RepID=A0AAN6ZH75_9PEZI|nr:hypothetical protein BT67DRAFT_120267 [Trichocladium antarcticum]